MAHADDLFEDAFFDAADPRQHKASCAITPVRELDGMAQGFTSLRFTTAKAKIPGLTVERLDDSTYRLSGPTVRRAAMSRTAFSLGSFMKADNTVYLTFADDMLDFKADDELVKQSKVPLWIIDPGTDGTVLIRRVWK